MQFRFKQFEVQHDQSTMKVGTDAVLLGSWANVERDETLLDVGTGCGIIALMVAQRNEKATIHALDIDEYSIRDAAQNFRRSPWTDRMVAHHISFQDFADETDQTFDHIVSNPPFFAGNKESVYPSRTKSRHTVYLSHDVFMSVSAALAHEASKLSIILPHLIADYFQVLASGNGFHLVRKTRIRHTTAHPVSRVLMEFRKRQALLKVEDMVLNGSDGQHSEAFRELTEAFYL